MLGKDLGIAWVGGGAGVVYPKGATLFGTNGMPLPFGLSKTRAYQIGDVLDNSCGIVNNACRVVEIGVGEVLIVEKINPPKN